MKSIVVAYDQSRAIGAHGALPWGRSLPADLRHFRELTTDGSVIMGRKTYESIGKALPHRENIVVSRQPIADVGVIVAASLVDAYKKAHGNQFIIGGASVYQQALADVDVIYATEVKATFSDADAYFPPLGREWRERARESHIADERNVYGYDFVTYVRR